MKHLSAVLVPVLAWLVVALTVSGCGSYPTKSKGHLDLATGDIEMETVELGTAIPMTGMELSTSERTPAEESGGWVGILSAVLLSVGGLQLAGPKSWANWRAIFSPSTSWGTTGHSLAANFGLAHTPKEAKSNETQRPTKGKES